MTLTPQDIINKEFLVKFRGYDRGEVDNFLERVAESFIKLHEQNIRLNEKISSQQEGSETGAVSSSGPLELPAELTNTLEELKQDTAAINAEIVSLKQGRSEFEKKVKGAIGSLLKTASAASGNEQAVIPSDLSVNLEKFLKETEQISAELAELKKEIGSIGQVHQEATGGEGTVLISEELADLKQEIGSIGQIRQEIKGEIEKLLQSHLDKLTATFSQAASTTAPVAAKDVPEETQSKAEKKEKLVETIIKEAEDAEMEIAEVSILPDFTEQSDGSDDVGLDFLSEDDILDVDKLRGVFQSVLDDSVEEAPESRLDEKDTGGDLLFFDDESFDEDQEPDVTFSLDMEEAEKKPAKKKKAN